MGLLSDVYCTDICSEDLNLHNDQYFSLSFSIMAARDGMQVVMEAQHLQDSDIFTRNYSTYYHNKKKRQDERILNFTMEVIQHGECQDGDCYIFLCKVSPAKSFKVGLTLGDLLSPETAIEKIRSQVQKAVYINKPAANKCQFNDHLMNKVTSFQDLLNSLSDLDQLAKKVTIMDKRGYYKSGDQIVYALNNDTILPAKNITTDETKHFSYAWIGAESMSQKLALGEPLEPKQLEDSLDEFCSYHGGNVGSIFMMISMAYLTQNRDIIQKCGFKLGTLHVVGPIDTGKSKALGQFKSLLPFIKYQDGSTEVYTDPTMTLPMMLNALKEHKNITMADPFPNFTATETTDLLDMAFEGTPKLTANSKERESKVNGNLFIVWSNENKSMPKCKPTALSKLIMAVHAKDDGIDEDNMEDLHCKILEDYEKLSGFYHSMITKIETEDLVSVRKRIKDELKTHFKVS